MPVFKRNKIRRLKVTIADKDGKFIMRFIGEIFQKRQTDGIFGEGDRVEETFKVTKLPRLLVSKEMFKNIKISKRG